MDSPSIFDFGLCKQQHIYLLGGTYFSSEVHTSIYHTLLFCLLSGQLSFQFLLLHLSCGGFKFMSYHGRQSIDVSSRGLHQDVSHLSMHNLCHLHPTTPDLCDHIIWPTSLPKANCYCITCQKYMYFLLSIQFLQVTIFNQNISELASCSKYFLCWINIPL